MQCLPEIAALSIQNPQLKVRRPELGIQTDCRFQKESNFRVTGMVWMTVVLLPKAQSIVVICESVIRLKFGESG